MNAAWPDAAAEVLPADHVASLSAAAEVISNSSSVAWYPMFGCAILALQPKDDQSVDLLLEQGHVALHLVGLDAWRLAMSRCGVSAASPKSKHYCSHMLLA